MKNSYDLIDAIIRHIQSIVSVDVFWGEPKQEQASDALYVTVDINNDHHLSIVDQKLLIGIRVVGSTHGAKKPVYDILHTITESLLDTQKDFGFDVWKVSTIGISPYLISEKGRGELVRDFYFYFLK